MPTTKSKKKAINWKSVNSRLDTIDALMQDVYKGTYHTDMSNNIALKNIESDIMGSIDALISSDSNISGIPDISRLYSRIQSKDQSSTKIGEFTEDIFDLFNDKKLMATLSSVYQQSASIRQYDEQIDMVCKCMPKMEDALQIKKDSVLVSETFSKDYLNLISGLNKDDPNFSSRAVRLKDKYGLEDLFDTMDYKTEKYGECFVYCVPYKKAFDDLLKKKTDANAASMGMYTEATIINDGQLSPIREGVSFNNAATFDKDAKFTLTMSYGLRDKLMRDSKAEKIKRKLPTSLTEQFLNEVALTEAAKDGDDKSRTKQSDFDVSVPDSLKLDYNPLDPSASDGFSDRDKKKETTKVNLPGCVIKILPRDRVFPIYIEESCIGYYYIEYQEVDEIATHTPFKGSMFSNGVMDKTTMKPDQDDKALKQIAATISAKIDAQFINANVDLSKEIYMILKYNEKFNIDMPSGNMSVSFIPADDIHHHYYRMDPTTHRGISDLQEGLIPAIIWSMISMCSAVGIVTRSHDKRVYYVQQTGVETNVAKTLMSVVNQIKKGNFGIRQFESINNIMGVVGKYNDMVVPTGPNGETPIRFEVMQGQNIEVPIDFLSQLEESAINPIGVPIELINATKGLDYAIHYTVSNSKYTALIQKRQGKEQRLQSSLITKIYDFEYEETTVIKVILPAPKFMTMANSNSVVDNVKQYVQNIVESFGYDLTEDEKPELTSLLMRYYLASHIDTDPIDEMKSLARVNVAARSTGQEQ